MPLRELFGYAVTAAAAGLVVFLAALAIYALRGLLVQVLVAAFIAVSLDPVVRWLVANKIKRSRAVALIVIVIALVLAGFGYATIPALVDQANQLCQDFPRLSAAPARAVAESRPPGGPLQPPAAD